MIIDIIKWILITGLSGAGIYHFGRGALGLIGIRPGALSKLLRIPSPDLDEDELAMVAPYRTEAPVDKPVKLPNRPKSAHVVPNAPETEDRHVRVEVSWVKRGVEHKVFYEGIYEAVKNVETGEFLIWGDEKMVKRAIWRHKREMRAGGRQP